MKRADEFFGHLQMKLLSRHPATMFWLGGMIAAFTVTHLPPQNTGKAVLNDKLLHFMGFAVLGLMTFWWRVRRETNSTRLRALLKGFTILAVHAMMDEVTQPLIGRSCEFGDWLADLGGAASGVIAGSCFLRVPAEVK